MDHAKHVRRRRSAAAAAEASLARPGVRGRNNGKGEGIAAMIRGRIVSGEYKPGDRLPPRRELQEQFCASAVTIHRTLEELQREGFVRGRGAAGTFVASNLPFLSHYGLVLPHIVAPRMEGPLALFHRDLYLEADRMRTEGPERYRIYQGVHRERDAGQIHAAVKAVEHHLIAGLILAVGWTAEHSPLQRAWEASGVPVVALSEPAHSIPGVPCVVADRELWLDRAFSRLAERGRRKVAILSGPGRELMPHIEARLLQFGAETRPYWTHFVHPDGAFEASHLMQLLMRVEERPDALLILDDSLVEPAVTGLRDSGTDTEAQLYVIGHCNYPQVTPAPLPIERLGFDVPLVLRTCMDILDGARRGESAAAVTRMAPVFQREHEQAFAEVTMVRRPRVSSR